MNKKTNSSKKPAEIKKPVDVAYEKGKDAGGRGIPKSANPYKDKSQANGAATFTKGFQNQWLQGWSDAGKQKE